MWRVLNNLPKVFRQAWEGSAVRPTQVSFEDEKRSSSSFEYRFQVLKPDGSSLAVNHATKNNEQNESEEQASPREKWKSAFHRPHHSILEAFGWGAAIVLGLQLHRPFRHSYPSEIEERKKRCLLHTIVALTQPHPLRQGILPQLEDDVEKGLDEGASGVVTESENLDGNEEQSVQKKADNWDFVKHEFDTARKKAYNAFGLHMAQSKQFASAAALFKTASTQGYAKAQYNLGICYERGIGVKKDPVEAANCYHKAATQGHAMAQYNLAIMLLSRQDVDRTAEAMDLLTKAAYGGIREAQTYVGEHYLEKFQYEKAVPLFQQAAKQNDAQAEYYLGMCYENGWGVERDLSTALSHYSEASSEGHVIATHCLGMFYERGLGGMPVNKSFAQELYQIAADAGDVTAKFDLERLQAWECASQESGVVRHKSSLHHSASSPDFHRISTKPKFRRVSFDRLFHSNASVQESEPHRNAVSFSLAGDEDEDLAESFALNSSASKPASCSTMELRRTKSNLDLVNSIQWTY